MDAGTAIILPDTRNVEEKEKKVNEMLMMNLIPSDIEMLE